MTLPMKPQLFLLHFAGGNGYSFNFLIPYLHSFEVVALELPGRGRRVAEPLLTNFTLAARDLFRQLLAKRKGGNFAIFGHSMGATLGLSISKMLTDADQPPTCLFVGGSAGPGANEPRNVHLLGREEFFSEVKSLGGLPEDLLSNRELLDFFEPILRADFQIADEGGLGEGHLVPLPIYAWMGSEEGTSSQIANWGKFTTKSMEYEILDGNHFFIHHHAKRIGQVMQEQYTKAVTYQN